MVYKFHSVKAIFDLGERRRRLAQLYRIFEDTAAVSSVSEAGNAATAEAKLNESTRLLDSTSKRPVEQGEA